MENTQENLKLKKTPKRPAKRFRKSEELRTEPPLSEKDEVKEAEGRLQNHNK